MHNSPARSALTVLALVLALFSPTASSAAEPLLSGPQQGRKALRILDASDESAVAGRNHRSAASLRKLIEDDPTVWLGRSGRIFYVDQASASEVSDAEEEPATPRSAAAWATPPLAETFALHSKPGSNHTVYLDFDGYTLGADDYWVTDGDIPAGAYAGFALDGSANFTDEEKTYIQTVWRIIAEKYAALDIDVTTETPASSDVLNRTSAGDETWGIRAVITNDMAARGTACTATAAGGCTGIAWVDVFDEVVGANTDRYQPAWVYTKFTAADAAPMSAGSVANTAAHEIGHTLGLDHDRIVAGGAYYAGHHNWFPIMGSSSRAVGHFTNGASYPLALTSQKDPVTENPNADDFDVMGKAGAPLRADDVTAPAALGAAPSYSRNGIIGTDADTDSFYLDRACTDDLVVEAEGIGLGQALDLKVTVRNPSNVVVATGNAATSADTSTHPDTPLDMDVSVTVPNAGVGVWTVTVEGTGLDPQNSTGYTGYGSVGQYHLEMSGCAVDGNPPGVPASVNVAPTSHSTTATATWGAAPVGGGDTPVTSYTIKVRSGATVLQTLTQASSQPRTRTITGLTPGVTYAVDVIATNADGDSPATTDSDVRIPTWAPTVAPVARPAVSGKTVTLNWSPPANPGQATIARSLVRVVRGTSTVYNQEFTGNPIPRPTKLLSAGSYQLRVAVNYSSDEGTVWTPTGSKNFVLAVPSAPVIRTASSGALGGSVNATVRWSAPSSFGSGPITSYRVYANKLNSRNQTVRSFTKSTSPSVRSLVWALPAGRYKLRVAAVNGVGVSRPSAYSAIVRSR